MPKAKIKDTQSNSGDALAERVAALEKELAKINAREAGATVPIEARIETLEREIQALKEALGNKPGDGKPGPNDWMKSFGRFKDDPTFDEAVRLGRAWRRRQPKC